MTNKNLKLLSLLFLIGNITLFGQIPKTQQSGIIENYYDWWQLQAGSSAHVFVEKAMIRSNPSTTAAIIDWLSVGAEVLVQQLYYPLTVVKGFRTPWVAIQYKSGGTNKQGYIWQGLLSLHAATNASGLLFISGVSAADNKSIENYETAYYIMTLKVLNGTSVICTKSWEQTYGEQTMVEGKLFENLGLKDCSNIYRLGLLGEACGVTSVYTYFAFNENELFALPGK